MSNEKETALVCFCFGHSRGDIRTDYRKNKTPEIPALILERINKQECDCKRLNPKGVCCLPEVSRVFGQIAAEEKIHNLALK